MKTATKQIEWCELAGCPKEHCVQCKADAEPKEDYGHPWFKRGQRVYVTANSYRNHKMIDHLIGQKVTITGRSWERGAYWYTIKTNAGWIYPACRMGDFKAL